MGFHIGFLGISNEDLMQTALAVGIFAGSVGIALLIAAALRRILGAFSSATRTDFDDLLANVLRTPLILLIVAQGLFIALQTLDYLDPYARWIGRAWLATTIAIVILVVQRLVTLVLTWYSGRPTRHGPPKIDPRSLPLVRRGVNILILAAGVLIILDTLGVAISPLLAGLGIGGLAVALALQPFLANAFASTYMLSDASIRIGDFIEVAGGPVGSVEDIGWRATRIRDFDNNIVLVPNTNLANSVVTNYDNPERRSDARVTFRVSYEEDLEQVERLCRDEMHAIRDELDIVFGGYDPLFLYTSFGEASVEILLKMRAMTWIDSFELTHLMLKRIHGRLSAEGIDLYYPARRLLLQEGDTAGLNGALPRQDPV